MSEADPKFGSALKDDWTWGPIFDADAHIDPPHDMWKDYLPNALKDRAPVIEHGEDCDYIVFEGNRRPVMMINNQAGREGKDFKMKGRLSEQKSILNNRREFRKQTARFFADTYEDQAILTASGISYALNTDGSTRTTPAGQDNWSDLLYAADVSAPSANRHFRWDATSGLVAGDTSQTDAADVPEYDMIPDIWAKARELRIPPLRIDGRDHLVWLVHTSTMAKLWKNADFRTIAARRDELLREWARRFDGKSAPRN